MASRLRCDDETMSIYCMLLCPRDIDTTTRRLTFDDISIRQRKRYDDSASPNSGVGCLLALKPVLRCFRSAFWCCLLPATCRAFFFSVSTSFSYLRFGTL